MEYSSIKIFSNSYKLDKVNIDIKYKNYQKIMKSREKSINNGRLKEKFTNWVPAKIQINNKNVDVKIKLKGTHEDHWSHPYKWSFKIKTKKDETVLGLKRFAVQNPNTLSYLYEWLFMMVLKEENLISHKIKFINLTVNGNDLGVYTLIEQPSKEMIERNNRREGPIIKFDKELWIDELNNHSNVGINDVGQTFWRSKIVPVSFKKKYRNTNQEAYLNKAINLLESFRNKKLKPDDVFDTDQLAKLMAIKAIFATSEFDWKDTKFYYNPVTQLLEPIAKEVHAVHNDFDNLSFWALDTDSIQLVWQKQFLDLLFEDKIFYEKFITELTRVSKPDYLQNIIKKHNKNFKKYLRILNKNYPTVEIFSEKHFSYNSKFLQDSLNPIQGINVNIENYRTDFLELNISNLQILPIKIIGIKFDNNNENFLNKEIYIEGKKHNKNFEKNLIKIDCLNYNCKDSKISEFKIIYRILGQEKNNYADIDFWTNSETVKNFLSKSKKTQNLEKYNFLKFKENKIFFKKGKWILNEQIIIPKDYELIFSPGTEVIFKDNAQIVSFSALSIIGEEDNPIIFGSNFDGNLKDYRFNNTGEDKYGNGILVLKTDKKTIIENTIFNKLSSPSLDSAKGLTGAITFYESDVEIKNSKFLNNLRGDDYLNIIRSKFLLENLLFENTNSDSVDIDFSNGAIKNSTFYKSSNDAIDFSGSNVNLSNIKISDTGDKAISAGEQSNIKINNISIFNSKMGLVSKDNTELKVQNAYLENTDIAVSAYIKKNEYGPASINIENIKIKDSKTEYLKQKNSIIHINQNLIADFNCDKNKKICSVLEE